MSGARTRRPGARAAAEARGGDPPRAPKRIRTPEDRIRHNRGLGWLGRCNPRAANMAAVVLASLRTTNVVGVSAIDTKGVPLHLMELAKWFEDLKTHPKTFRAGCQRTLYPPGSYYDTGHGVVMGPVNPATVILSLTAFCRLLARAGAPAPLRYIRVSNVVCAIKLDGVDLKALHDLAPDCVKYGKPFPGASARAHNMPDLPDHHPAIEIFPSGNANFTGCTTEAHAYAVAQFLYATLIHYATIDYLRSTTPEQRAADAVFRKNILVPLAGALADLGLTVGSGADGAHLSFRIDRPNAVASVLAAAFAHVKTEPGVVPVKTEPVLQPLVFAPPRAAAVA